MRRLILTVVAVISLAAAAPSGLLAQEATPATGMGEAVDPALCRVEPRTAEEIFALRAEDAPEGEPYADATLKAAPVPLGEPADAETVAAVTATIREAYACTNAGDFGRFAVLLSDAALGRQIGSVEDVTLEIVQSALAEIDPRSAADRQRLLAVTDVSVMDDGRVAAFVVDDDPTEPPEGPETEVLIFVEERGRWVVDGILDFTDDEAFAGQEGAATPAAELPGVSGRTYRSPTFGYELAWEIFWTVEYSTSANGQDQLRLSNGPVQANFQGSAAGAGTTLPADATACLDAVIRVAAMDARMANFGPAPASVGMPIGGGPNVAAGAYVGDVTNQGGDTTEVALFVSCRSLGPDAVLVTTYAMPRAMASQVEPMLRALDASLVLPDVATPST